MRMLQNRKHFNYSRQKQPISKTCRQLLSENKKKTCRIHTYCILATSNLPPMLGPRTSPTEYEVIHTAIPTD